jgi:predicted transcriptional regulator
MKNITFAIDDDVLDKVRIVAAQRKTTVNALVREFLSEIATRDEKREEARKRLLELMDTSEGRMAADWKFNREETYER